jgi:hypothetical protein
MCNNFHVPVVMPPADRFMESKRVGVHSLSNVSKGSVTQLHFGQNSP